MIIEPKLLSTEELKTMIIDRRTTAYYLAAHAAALAEQIIAKDADIERLKEGMEQAAKQLHHIMRNAEMSSEIMLDPKRTGNRAGARKTADAFDHIGLRAAEAKADVCAALTPNQGSFYRDENL